MDRSTPSRPMANRAVHKPGRWVRLTGDSVRRLLTARGYVYHNRRLPSQVRSTMLDRRRALLTALITTVDLLWRNFSTSRGARAKKCVTWEQPRPLLSGSSFVRLDLLWLTSVLNLEFSFSTVTTRKATRKLQETSLLQSDRATRLS